jgi:micrococcal nuclease
VDTSKPSALIERVRLLGIEAPDMKQRPWGTAAQEKLKQLIGGQIVLLESEGSTKDQFERTLAYVWKDGMLVNEQLVVEGYVYVPRSINNKYEQKANQCPRIRPTYGKRHLEPGKTHALDPN